MNDAPQLDIGTLGFDSGAHILVKLALLPLATGGEVTVRGDHPEFIGELAAWCRAHGHQMRVDNDEHAKQPFAVVVRGAAMSARWVGAQRAGESDSTKVSELDGEPLAEWGLAPRGATVELGGPRPSFALAKRDELWTDRASSLYRQALASQWDPHTAIDWSTPIEHHEAVEHAIVQVMTFLIENEQAALVVPTRFLGQIHPYFREIQQMLAVTIADEARHIEVFTRRAVASGLPLALSTAGGRASLQTLIDEPDYATAAFLLSVMGEGTFVSLLSFLERHAPDSVTRRIAHLTRQDEARHVAFAMSHLERHAQLDPALRSRLANAVERRHQALQHTAGLNEEVFDSLVLLAAGAPDPVAIRAGWRAVQDLQREMADARQSRLARLGFTAGERGTLAALHSRNFM